MKYVWEREKDYFEIQMDIFLLWSSIIRMQMDLSPETNLH